MCPTLCIGDRLVADTLAYRSQPPHRGDLVILAHSGFDTLLVKRVVGVPGDLVQHSANQQILVNGQPFQFPAQCGTSESWSDSSDCFETTKVPAGSYFVIGDNLAHSLDSRYPDFGMVRQDELRGQPLFLYWSSNKKRIGCDLH